MGSFSDLTSNYFRRTYTLRLIIPQALVDIADTLDLSGCRAGLHSVARQWLTESVDVHGRPKSCNRIGGMDLDLVALSTLGLTPGNPHDASQIEALVRSLACPSSCPLNTVLDHSVLLIHLALYPGNCTPAQRIKLRGSTFRLYLDVPVAWQWISGGRYLRLASC